MRNVKVAKDLLKRNIFTDNKFLFKSCVAKYRDRCGFHHKIKHHVTSYMLRF